MNIYPIPTNVVSLFTFLFQNVGVLKIDPRTDTVSVLYLPDGTLLPAGQWKWHGGLRVKHKIYGFPNNADSVLVINCTTGIVYTIGNDDNNNNNNNNKTASTFLPILQSGRHRIPADGRYKYLGGATTIDERYVYLFPCDAERVLRIDCVTDTITCIGPLLLDGENKFQNGFVAHDGCLYGIPQRAIGVLRIIPASVQYKRMIKKLQGNKNTGTVDETQFEDIVDIMVCEGLEGVKDKFEGGVMGSDGCIYCIPLRSKVCVKIVPGSALESGSAVPYQDS
jgi:hypothetical protein